MLFWFLFCDDIPQISYDIYDNPVMLNFVMIICVMIFWSCCDDTVVMLSSNPEIASYLNIIFDVSTTFSLQFQLSK